MLLQSVSSPVCETFESSTKTPCFRVPGISFTHMKAFYQKISTWQHIEWSQASGYIALVSKKDDQRIKYPRLISMKKKLIFQTKRLIFNLQYPWMTAMTCQPQCGSFWSFLLGWLSRTSRMHQSEGSFLPSLARAHWLAEGMALKDTWVRTAPPAHKFHVTHTTYKLAWSRGGGALPYFTHTQQSVAIQVLPHKKMRLIKNRWWIFWFFAIFFYSFRILHL